MNLTYGEYDARGIMKHVNHAHETGVSEVRLVHNDRGFAVVLYDETMSEPMSTLQYMSIINLMDGYSGSGDIKWTDFVNSLHNHDSSELMESITDISDLFEV